MLRKNVNVKKKLQDIRINRSVMKILLPKEQT